MIGRRYTFNMNPRPADRLSIAIAQLNPTVGDVVGNAEKVRRARLMLDEAESDAALEVDGGIARDTIREVWSAGADTFVAGNAIFTARDATAEIAALRAQCEVLV